MRVKGVMLLMMSSVTCSAMANVTISGELKGERVSWSNVTSSRIAGDSEPHQWTPVEGLASTSRWVPGGLVTSVTEVTVRRNGVAVTLPFDVMGVAYHAVKQGPTEAASSITPICTSTESDVGLAWVKGEHCFAPRQWVSAERITPFSFVKPLFRLGDDAAIAQAFSQANAEPGEYLGTAFMTYRYAYDYEGVNTLRQLSLPIDVRLHYNPASITSVSLIGDGKITPRIGNGVALSGEANYIIKATGTFVNGMSLSLQHPTRTFEMKKIDNVLATPLPYFLRCLSSCSDDEWIDVNGHARVTTVTVGGEGSALEVKLQTGIDELPLMDLEDGEYSDTFTLLLEANY